jgi:hypothetical protein
MKISRATSFSLAAAFVPLVLLLDGPGLARQATLGLATAALVAFLVVRFEVPPRQILCAIAVATLGEIVLSIGWGLYDYRHALIPLYVPAGHGLFYLLAVVTARQPWLVRRRQSVKYFIVAAGSIAAFIGLAYGDQLGFLWWIACAMILWRSQHALVMSSCIVYTSALEILGTTLGNWHWTATVPFLGIGAGNPPVGVGILYITLDVIVIAMTGYLRLPAIFLGRFNMSRRSLPALKRMFFEAGMVIFSFVRGLRPSRALRWVTLKLPRPGMAQRSPR